MTTRLIVREGDYAIDLAGIDATIVDVDDYLTSPDYFKLKNAQVINLCKDYSYLSVGYYCSLLAEARRHRAIPSVKTMLDLSSKAMYSLDTGYLDELIQKSFTRYTGLQERKFEMDVHFGICQYEPLTSLARQLFETFPCPSMRISFQRDKKWHIARIKPLSIQRLGQEQAQQFNEALAGYIKKRWRGARRNKPVRYDLAILHNPQDPMPPSDKQALQAFIKAGRKLGIEVDLIEKSDYAALAEYDALFIRDTTQINHYTYRFAKKAESEGMVVIDDPTSILRCTNKVYLAELLRNHRVPIPKTVIVGKNDLQAAIAAIGFPMVLKVPDGSFSQGVFKAEDVQQFNDITSRLFQSSELILAQEYIYTDFDWRIGVLNKKPIYASQYFMSKKHWQIVHYGSDGKFTQGAFKTLAVAEAPADVVSEALKAANLIGDGLYGVDVKQNEQGARIIEVNDNPSIESGVEDAVIKDELYQMIMAEFLRRLELRHGRVL